MDYKLGKIIEDIVYRIDKKLFINGFEYLKEKEPTLEELEDLLKDIREILSTNLPTTE